MRTVIVTALVTALAGAVGVALFDGARDLGNKVSDEVSGDPPVHVTAIVERDEAIQGNTWILPDPLDPTAEDDALLADPYGSGASSALFNSWARGHEGADPEVSFVKLIVEGRERASTVRLIDMKAAIVKRAPPLSGTLLSFGPQGANEVTEVGFDLDENDPVARVIDKQTRKVGEPYFGTVDTKTLQYGEQEVFRITGYTARNYVEWCVDLHLLIDDRIEEVRSCPEGSAVRTTAYHMGSVTNPFGDAVSAIDSAQYQRLYVYDYSTNGFVQKDPKTHHWW